MHPPRETSATTPASERAGRVEERGSFGSEPVLPQSVTLDRLAVCAGDRPDVHQRLVGVLPGRGNVEVVGERHVLDAGGGARAASPSAPGAKTWRLEDAATEIADGALLGDPTEPSPKSSRSFPAEITGTTPAAATFSSAWDQRVARRVGLGASAREVDHVHAVVHGGLEGEHDLGRERVEPAGQDGTLNTR